MTLAKKLRLETGRMFLKVSLSKEGFFSKGVTKACLNLSGKTPSASERLIMLVIGVRRTPMMIKVGQGSKLQDSVGDFDMSFLTSS